MCINRVHKRNILLVIYITVHIRRSILTLSTHLRLGLASGLFPPGFPTNINVDSLRLKIQMTELSICGNRNLPNQLIAINIDIKAIGGDETEWIYVAPDRFQ
jgi:hypothetical protein